MSHDDIRRGEPVSALADDTVAVRTRVDGSRAHRPLNAPLLQTSQWEAESLETLAEHFARDPDGGFYTRFGHPTLRLAEEKLAALEHSENALVFGSGMGAITTSVLSVVEAGDHVVAHRAIFAETIQYLEHLRDVFGVSVTFVDATDPSEVEDAMQPATKLLYLETPSNPIIDILDISALSRIAHHRDALVFVDSTFAGPLIQRPVEFGADLSIQSASKSLAGHADLLAGSAAGSEELIARIRQMRTLTGPVLDPHACSLLLRGIQTLPLRVRKKCETAFELARLLESSSEVDFIRYPYLESHPAHAVARSQMKSGGTVLSFSPDGGIEATRRFVEALDWIPIAPSLGSVYTSVEVPEDLDVTAEEDGESAASFSLPPGLIRLSVGAEAFADLEREIQRGLTAVRKAGASGTSREA